MRVRRMLVGAAAAAMFAAGIGGACVQRAATARWAEMVAWAQRSEAAWHARDFTRAPLCGEAAPGSAFAAYREAVALAVPLGRGEDASRLLIDLRLRPERVTPADAEAFAARWAPPLAAMREGAHRSDARPPIEWAKGISHPMQNLLDGRNLVNAATIASRRLHADGHDLEAVTMLLDAATFGVDLARSPLLIEQMIGAALVGITADQAWRDEDLRALDSKALRLLADGLARFDALCPRVVAFDAEPLLLANTLLHEDLRAALAKDLPLPSLRTWRYGWSALWASADAVLLEAAVSAELVAAADLPWPQRQALAESLLTSERLSANPLLPSCLPSLEAAETSMRQVLTGMRLLRLAVAWHLGDELPQLQDPLGTGNLQVERSDAAARFRSAGQAGGKSKERLAAAR